MNLLPDIKKLFAHGVECFPCTVHLATGKKKPILPAGWQNRTFKPSEAFGMIKPDHNMIAIKTGEASKLWVLDVDCKPGKPSGTDTLSIAGIDVPGGTPCQATPSGGRHYFFCGEDAPSFNRPGTLGLDGRGNGGLIFCCGEGYTWQVPLIRGNLKPIPQEILSLFGEKQPKTELKTENNADFDDLDLEIVKNSILQDEKTASLFSGEWQDLFPSQSEADLSLMSSLAFYSKGNTEIMEQLFRESGLFRPEGKGADYLDRTITRALHKTEFKLDFGKIFIPSWDNAPVERDPLIELNDVRILSPGNLSMITAGAGAGKSSLMEAACSSVLVPFGADTLGVRVNVKSLVYIDTERSHADHHRSWKRFMSRSGLNQGDTMPQSIRWVNIRGLETLQSRLAYLWTVLDADSAPEVVLIDGIGDFVNDPNDSEEVCTLISKLSAIVHNRDIGVLLTLHNNPAVNSTKARGVLGSELWRKCEFSGMIEKLPDGVRRLTSNYDLGKNRSGSDTVQACFRWDDEMKMHVSINAPIEKLPKTKTARQADLVIQTMGDGKYTRGEVVKIIMDVVGVKKRAAEDRINDLLESQKLEKIGDAFRVANVKEDLCIYD